MLGSAHLYLFATLALGEGEAVFTYPPGVEFAAPHAVGHVAVVEENLVGPPRIVRNTVTRSGSWLRVERGPGSYVHADYSSGITIAYSRDSSGTLRSLSINRVRSSETYYRYHRVRTDQRDEALGETCEVWKITRVGDRARTGVDWLSCETTDGIQLWRRSVSQRSGSTITSSRTIQFRRQRVPATQVQPPRDLLDRSYWLDLLSLGRSADPGQPNYEVRLKSIAESGAPWRILRRRGEWISSETGGGDDEVSLSTHNPTFAAHYFSESKGRPVRLSLSILPSNAMGSGVHSFVPLEPIRTEHLLGEDCTWSTWKDLSVSGDHRQCVTSDGIALRIYDHHRVLAADLQATLLKRHAPRLDDMMPPRGAFEWERWGVRLDD